MERFMSIFKRHPLAIVGAVVGVIVVVWLMSRGSSGAGATTVVSMGPSDVTVAANASIESERIKSNAMGAAAVAALDMAKIQAESYALFLGTSKDVNEDNLASNERLASIVTGAQNTNTQIIVDGTKELATIDKNKATDLANIGAALQKEQIQGANAVAVANANAATTIAQLQATQAANELAAKTSLSGNWWVAMNPDTMDALWGGTPNSVTNVTANFPGQNPSLLGGQNG